MVASDELMKIEGVVAAGPFGDDRKLVDVRGQLKPEVGRAAAVLWHGEHAFQNNERLIPAAE